MMMMMMMMMCRRIQNEIERRNQGRFFCHTFVSERRVEDARPSGEEVKAAADAIKEKTGLTPELATSGGTSDARFVKNYCPVFEFGPLNQTIHQVDENVPVAHLELLTDIYEAFIVRYFEAFTSG